MNLRIPSVGQAVHVRSRRIRIGDKVMPDTNGYIFDIDYQDEVALVRFYSSQELDEYPFDELMYHWTDKYGGLYELE